VVLQLVDEGKLRLDDDVTKYVPEAPTLGHHVTVRQLLNHTLGIYSFTSLPDTANNDRFELTHDQVLGLIKDKPFDFEPGTRWRYDNSALLPRGHGRGAGYEVGVRRMSARARLQTVGDEFGFTVRCAHGRAAPGVGL
jgi:hypothetical protein